MCKFIPADTAGGPYWTDFDDLSDWKGHLLFVAGISQLHVFLTVFKSNMFNLGKYSHRSERPVPQRTSTWKIENGFVRRLITANSNLGSNWKQMLVKCVNILFDLAIDINKHLM